MLAFLATVCTAAVAIEIVQNWDKIMLSLRTIIALSSNLIDYCSRYDSRIEACRTKLLRWKYDVANRISSHVVFVAFTEEEEDSLETILKELSTIAQSVKDAWTRSAKEKKRLTDEIETLRQKVHEFMSHYSTSGDNEQKKSFMKHLNETFSPLEK